MHYAELSNQESSGKTRKIKHVVQGKIVMEVGRSAY